MNLVVLTSLSLAWFFVLVRLRYFLRSPKERVVTAMFFFLAVPATLVIRDVRYAIDAFTGVPDLAILISHFSSLAGIIAALQFTLMVTARWRAFVRGSQVFLVVTQVLAVVLFQFIPRRLDQPDFGYWHAKHPAVLTWQLEYLVCFTVALVVGGTALFQLWRSSARGPLRIALFLLWLGVVTGIAYAGCRFWYVVAHGFGFAERAARPLYGAITAGLLYLSVILLVAGGLVRGAWKARRYLRRAMGQRRLHPLWTELVEAAPAVVLQRTPRLFSGSSLELRLYRLTVEIRDAQLELVARVSPDNRDAAKAALEESGVADRLALDACVLRIALEIEDVRNDNPVEVSWSPAANLDEELADLLELDHLMRSPAVVAAAKSVATRRYA